MTIKPFLILAALLLGTAAPAAAEIVTFAAEGQVTAIADEANSAFRLTDRVTARISFNVNDVYEIDGDGFSFIAMGPGADFQVSIGNHRWTLSDFASSFAPGPLLRFGGERLELVATAFSSEGSFLFTGLSRFGFGTPGSFMFGEPDGFDFANQGELGEFQLAAGAVPEPQTWLVLTMGFAMTGIALRRRQLGAA